MKCGQKQAGFTIVELLIVVVVIAILAAITIVSYNGISTRAENTKTVSAVAAWAKALHMYKTDTGDYPATNSCLGSTTTYTGFNNRCWAPDSSTWTVNSSFLSSMSDYMKTPAEPSSRNINTDADQYKGAIYYRVSSSDVRIYVNVIGADAVCPTISVINNAYSSVDRAGGKSCYYRLPQ
jgi:prepilin-type N-terminal cleavage/methylation domain-containing protein